MKRVAQVVVALLVCSMTVLAQDNPAAKTTPDNEVKADTYRGVSVGYRAIFLGGEAFDGSDWNEFFGVGSGFGLQYSHLWQTSEQFAIGLYGGFTLDNFSGDEARIGAFTIEASSLSIYRLIFGTRARQDYGGFFMDENVGIGAAFYGDVDARLSGGGITVNTNAIEASTEFTFEAGYRVGLRLNNKFDIGIGFAYEGNSGPDVGSDYDTLLGSFGWQMNLVSSLSVNLRF